MEDALTNKPPAAPAISEDEKDDAPVEITWTPTAAQMKKLQVGVAITNQVVSRLVTAFRRDASIAEACRYAGISRPTYYKAVEQNLDFALLMEEAQATVNQLADKVIRRSLQDDDVVTARWYKDRRDERYKPKQSAASIGKQYNQFIIGDGRVESTPSEKPTIDVQPSE